MFAFALLLVSGCTKELPLDEFCDIVAPAEGACAQPALDACLTELDGKSNDCRGCWLGAVTFVDETPEDGTVPVCTVTRDSECAESCPAE